MGQIVFAESSNAVFLLQIFFLLLWMWIRDLSLFVPWKYFLWCPGKAVLRDSGLFWVTSFKFSNKT